MTKVDENKELIRRIRPVDKSLADKLWKLHQVTDDAKGILENNSLFQILAGNKANSNYLDEIRLPPQSTSLLHGDYHIGSVIYPDKPYSDVGLRKSELIKHLLIVGMTGSGKTNLCYQILKELAEDNIPFLVFDWKKSYRKLKSLPQFKNLQVITLGEKETNFTFNPLIPPFGVHPKHWMGMIVDVLKHSFFVSYGPEYWFRMAIDRLYKQYGVYEGKTVYPTFIEIEKTLSKEYVRGRELLWMNSVKRVLAVLTRSSLLGEIVNVPKQSKIEELLTKPVIIELENLSIVERIFIVESLLLWIYHYRKNQGASKRLKHVLVIEEGHHILSARKEYESGGESIIETTVRMIREFGQSVVVLDQEPSKISKSIIANCGTKISLSLGRFEDMKVMAGALGIDNSKTHWLGRLAVGTGILGIQNRIVDPVLVQFPLIQNNKNKINSFINI